MTAIAVCPGSFDPVTRGHMDVFAKTSRMFDQVIALVVHNPKKNPAFSLDRRAQLLRASLDEVGLNQVAVDTLAEGLLVDYCTDHGADVLVKGIRGDLDVSYETPMAIVNRNLAAVETVFVLPEPEHSHVSSSLVRTLAGFGGDISPYVPGPVVRAYSEAGMIGHRDTRGVGAHLPTGTIPRVPGPGERPGDAVAGTVTPAPATSSTAQPSPDPSPLGTSATATQPDPGTPAP